MLYASCSFSPTINHGNLRVLEQQGDSPSFWRTRISENPRAKTGQLPEGLLLGQELLPLLVNLALHLELNLAQLVTSHQKCKQNTDMR